MHRRPRSRRVLFAVTALILLAQGGCGGDGGTVATPTRGGSVASPTTEGPVTGGLGEPFLGTTTFDLALVGYEQAEYFISGTATAYTNAAALMADGRWTVAPGDTAFYKTRIVVYRPIHTSDFNGTVIVEWLNVSGGIDAGADWIAAHTELTREGFAWVGVSAQKVGVEGGVSVLGLPLRALKSEDPERYGSLAHPGDSFSYDIFSQAGQALRRPSGVDPLGGLAVRAIIAAGESQSAFRLVTYIDAIHPRDDMYDGFFVHSRGGAGGVAPLSEKPQAAISVPGTALIRTDLDVPVFTFETETDLTLLGYASARQADSDRFRLWEVAGAAHADTYTTGVGITDVGDSPDAAKIVITANAAGLECNRPINSGPHHFVLDAAFAAMNDWVVHGTPPPTAPRIQTTPTGSPPAIVRDARGNALGGVRTPWVDTPIATVSGDGQIGSLFCIIFGTTTPFDEATLAALYPTQADYVAAYDAATDRAVAAGFIRPADAALMKEAAAATDLPGGR